MSLQSLLESGERPVLTARAAGQSTAAASTRCAGTSSRSAPYVDAINATDNPAASCARLNVAMSHSDAAGKASSQIMQVVLPRQEPGRAIQADIVGAVHARRSEHLRARPVDDVTAGDGPEGATVFDL